MERLEILYWVSTLKMAKLGNTEAQETLNVENATRKEQGLPTIEDELKVMANLVSKIN